jgi:hypothetical protein
MSIDIKDRKVLHAIENRLFALKAQYQQAFAATVPQGIEETVQRAQLLARRLAGAEGWTAGRNTAQGLLEVLVPQAEQQSRAFWESHLGQVLAWWSGGLGSTARRRMIAEAVTGISRQGIAKAVRDGNLELDVDGSDVAAESLAQFLQRRYPNEVTP